MRSELATAILAEAEGKLRRPLPPRQRFEFLHAVDAAIAHIQDDTIGATESELARLERIVDGLEQAIAAMTMAEPMSLYASETAALAALVQSRGGGRFPARGGAVKLLRMRDDAFDKILAIDHVVSKAERGKWEPLTGPRWPAELQVLTLSLTTAWAVHVDARLGLKEDGPLVRFIRTCIAEAIEGDPPPASSIFDFVKKWSKDAVRDHVGKLPTEPEVDLSAILLD